MMSAENSFILNSTPIPAPKETESNSDSAEKMTSTSNAEESQFDSDNQESDFDDLLAFFDEDEDIDWDFSEEETTPSKPVPYEWFEPCDDQKQFIVASYFQGTSWNEIQPEEFQKGRLSDEGEHSILFWNNCLNNIEGEAYSFSDDVFSSPLPYDFYQWFQRYALQARLRDCFDEDTWEEEADAAWQLLTETPLTIQNKNGVALLMVGLPFADKGNPRLECFVMTQKCKMTHFSYDFREPFQEEIFQKNIFTRIAYNLLKNEKLLDTKIKEIEGISMAGWHLNPVLTNYRAKALTYPSLDWVLKYNSIEIEETADIHIAGKVFAFSMYHSDRMGNTGIVQELREQGGEYSRTVTKAIDYLIIGNEDWQESSIKAAAELLKKGCQIKFAYMNQLRKALGLPIYWGFLRID